MDLLCFIFSNLTSDHLQADLLVSFHCEENFKFTTRSICSCCLDFCSCKRSKA